MLFKLLLFFTGVFFLYSAAYPYSIKSHDFENLENGKIFIKPIKQNSVKGTETAILIDAPREKVWQVLEEKHNLPKIIRQVEKTRVLCDDGQAQVVETSIKICKILPCFNYIICFDNSEKYEKMTFKKTEGCFKELFGCFEFISYGNSTVLNCQVYANPGFYIPIFIGKGLKSDIEVIMKAIKTEAEKNN